MRAYRARPPVALLTAAALAWALPAAAQTDKPLELVPPPGTPASSTMPQPLPAPAPAADAASPAAAPPSDAGAPAAADTGIQVAPLEAVDTSWTGTLDPAAGGFPHDMWSGTQQSLVATALPLLQPIASPAALSLARRLLLSDAAAPSATAGAAGEPGLLALRVDRLYALGLVNDGLALTQRISAANATAELLNRDRIELRAASGDFAAACQDLADHVAQFQGLWWDRAGVACAALTNDSAKASLGMSILNDEKAPPDPAFDAMVLRLTGRASSKVALKVPSLPDPSPLRLAVLAAAKQPLPADALASAGPAALAGYAGNDAVAPELRLAAAERAAQLGSLAPDALGALYGRIDFKPAELDAAKKAVKPPANSHQRALLFSLAHLAAEPAAREAAITALMADARQRGALMATAKLLAPTLDEIPATGADKGFAAVASRILLAAGRADAAQPWIDAAQDKAAEILARIAKPGVPQVDADLARAALAGLNADDGAASHAADLLYSLLTGLGADPAALGSLAMAAPPRAGALPNAALWDAQLRAVQGKRLGETVLTTLLIAQSDGRLTQEPIVLKRAVEGLKAVGLDADAHALALEAALEAGI